MREVLQHIQSKNLLELSNDLNFLINFDKNTEKMFNNNKDFCLSAVEYCFKTNCVISDNILSWCYFNLFNDKVSYPYLVSFFDSTQNLKLSLIDCINNKYIKNINEVFNNDHFFNFFQDKESLSTDYYEKMIAYPLKTNFINLIDVQNHSLIIGLLKKLDSFYAKKNITVISKPIGLIDLLNKHNRLNNTLTTKYKEIPYELNSIIKELEKNYIFLTTINLNETDKIKIESFWTIDVNKIINSFKEYENIKKQTNQNIDHLSGKSALDLALSSLDEINSYFKKLILNEQEEKVKDLSIQNRYTKVKKD